MAKVEVETKVENTIKLILSEEEATELCSAIGKIREAHPLDHPLTYELNKDLVHKLASLKEERIHRLACLEQKDTASHLKNR